jgi:hypothetical protein
VTNFHSTALKSVSFDLLGDLKVFKGGLDPKFSITFDAEKFVLELEICGPLVATERDMKQNPKRVLKCSRTGYSIFIWHGNKETFLFLK